MENAKINTASFLVAAGVYLFFVEIGPVSGICLSALVLAVSFLYASGSNRRRTRARKAARSVFALSLAGCFVLSLESLARAKDPAFLAPATALAFMSFCADFVSIKRVKNQNRGNR